MNHAHKPSGRDSREGRCLRPACGPLLSPDGSLKPWASSRTFLCIQTATHVSTQATIWICVSTHLLQRDTLSCSSSQECRVRARWLQRKPHLTRSSTNTGAHDLTCFSQACRRPGLPCTRPRTVTGRKVRDRRGKDVTLPSGHLLHLPGTGTAHRFASTCHRVSVCVSLR